MAEGCVLQMLPSKPHSLTTPARSSNIMPRWKSPPPIRCHVEEILPPIRFRVTFPSTDNGQAEQMGGFAEIWIVCRGGLQQAATTTTREAKAEAKISKKKMMTMIGAVANHAAIVGRRAFARSFATVGSQIPSVELHS